MTEILATLKKLYDEQGERVERWLGRQRQQAEPFFYTSVDLRHSGLRLAPVDTNLFPAGFNNLSPKARQRAMRFIARYLQESHPGARRVLIVPENHTRNLNYLENLAVLSSLIEGAGAEVQLGSLAAEKGQVLELQSATGQKVVQHSLVRDGKTLLLENGYKPDLIIMNNDLTGGSREILENVEQPVVPPLGMGWYRRRKSVHFDSYRLIARQFAEHFNIDPWLLSAEFHGCGQIDFKERTGLDCLAKAIDEIIAKARAKHAQYGITDDPYVFVKADSGTYGMGIMTVKSGGEILELNKKDRNKMQTVKEGAHVSEVIVQEGIATIDTVDGKPAEPMVYMIDGVPVGGMWRVNGARDAQNNLNAAGMEFAGMCDETEFRDCPELKAVNDCNFRSFGIIAAMAALAAARENYESYMINL